MTHAGKRNQKGSLVDLGPALWFFLFLLALPLLNLATVALRYTFLLGASRDAAYMAASAKTFQTSLDAADPSASVIAAQRAQANCQSFSGVNYIGTQTDLVITNLNTNAITTQSTPLSSPADTSNYLYQIKVIVTAKVWPLLPYNDKIMPNIPGLMSPVEYSVPTIEMCENPSGMNE